MIKPLKLAMWQAVQYKDEYHTRIHVLTNFKQTALKQALKYPHRHT